MSIRLLAMPFVLLLLCSALFAQDAPLQIIEQPKPELPKDYGSLDVTGTVRLRVQFLANGKVGDVKVVSNLPVSGLTEQAVEAAKKIKFTPLQKDGQPVDSFKVVIYEYSWEFGWHGGWKVPEPEKIKDSPLRIIERPKPELPKGYGTLDAQGTISLRVTFLATGEVGDVTVVSGLTGRLEELAVEAAKKIRFDPKIVNGKPVNTTRAIQYVYLYWKGGWQDPIAPKEATKPRK